jgi:Zn-dependent metalloprotease
MDYGDGDGIVFDRFTRSLDVVGHELTHGVVTFTANLDYEDQPGALNEHFADVMGILVRQWRKNQSAAKASWLIGAELLKPAPTRRALRDMAAPGTAYVDDPDLGTDPQPKHMDDFYDGPDDNGGVHINSGILNHAFFKVATALGGKAWEKAGRIWYEALRMLSAKSQFQEAAECVSFSGRAAAYSELHVNAIPRIWLNLQRERLRSCLSGPTSTARSTRPRAARAMPRATS